MSNPNTLTKRELEILKLLVLDFSNAEISDYLKISIHTAKSHVHNILEKLGLKNRQQAKIIGMNLVDLKPKA